MKKIFALLVAASCLATVTFAQGKKDDKQKAPAKKEAVKPVVKTAEKKEAAKPAEKTEAKEHLKKDGTPDKRFKENKETKEVHLKKDGTPDKRFKENKEPAKKKG
ncbi:hypothetical protein GALL_47810 [mine drainage metagenome]|uniref:Colicin import membrane protein n=1 Tax=mine drainage metagenome TaxID=410659 RepID=A0A1J5T0E6_9ZZZZ